MQDGRAGSRGRKSTILLDAIGSEATASEIVDAVAPGGSAVMVGIPGPQVRAAIRPFQMVFQEKSLTGSFYGSVRPDVDFPLLCDLYMGRLIDLDDLISRTYRLDEINEGFAALRAGSVARGVVVFD